MDVRSGGIFINVERPLGYTGANGSVWSVAINSDTTHAYSLTLSPGYVYLSYDNYRYFGFPLRCLARQYIIYSRVRGFCKKEELSCNNICVVEFLCSNRETQRIQLFCSMLAKN